MGHRTLFIASKTPKTKQEWEESLNSIEDYDIANKIADADYTELVSDPDYLNNLYLSGQFPCDYINYNKAPNDSNFKAEISPSARQECRKWEAKVYHDYADDLAKGKQFTKSWFLVDSFSNDVDFLFVDEDCYRFGTLLNQYSEELPDHFFICRDFYYNYHV